MADDPLPRCPNDGLADHYSFTCDVADITARIRALPHCYVKEGAEIAVACRLVHEGKSQLFRSGYNGRPHAEDGQLLLAALTADERTHPGSYSKEPRANKPARPIHFMEDDFVLELDFVDPQIGHEEGNVIAVTRRTIRLRDRLSLDELDAVSAYYQARARKRSRGLGDAGGRGRWLVLPR